MLHPLAAFSRLCQLVFVTGDKGFYSHFTQFRIDIVFFWNGYIVLELGVRTAPSQLVLHLHHLVWWALTHLWCFVTKVKNNVLSVSFLRLPKSRVLCQLWFKHRMSFKTLFSIRGINKDPQRMKEIRNKKNRNSNWNRRIFAGFSV